MCVWGGGGGGLGRGQEVVTETVCLTILSKGGPILEGLPGPGKETEFTKVASLNRISLLEMS